MEERGGYRRRDERGGERGGGGGGGERKERKGMEGSRVEEKQYYRVEIEKDRVRQSRVIHSGVGLREMEGERGDRRGEGMGDAGLTD